MSHTKKSYGIIVCRRNRSRQWEALMVKKRNTYAFVEFILRKHNRKDEKSIMFLLDRMTYDEKVDLLSCNFGQIWHRFQLFNPETPGARLPNDIMSLEDYEKYKLRKNNFERTFLMDRGKLLKRLIGRSRHSMNTWEIPKGRRNGPEKVLNCAIRETSEETGLFPSDYRMLNDEKLINITQETSFVRYESYYYIAVMEDHKFQPRLNERMGIGKPSEIAEVKWMNINEIAIVDSSGKMLQAVKEAHKIIRQKTNYDYLLDLDLI